MPFRSIQPWINWLQARWRRETRPSLGWGRFGLLRRVSSVDRQFGFDRGSPVDRYYIERFLADHSQDVAGRVLEIGDNFYTRRFGKDRVTKSDVLHVTEGNAGATVVADLADASGIPSDLFDCIILTQTLHFIYDVRAAVRTLHRILKPGGVCLATLPGISQVETRAWGAAYWAFTTHAARKLFQEVFPPSSVHVDSYGNVLAGCAFLYGLAAEELRHRELDYLDPEYQVVVTVRAGKAEARQ
jgi:SAM-dependent methyltransferase